MPVHRDREHVWAETGADRLCRRRDLEREWSRHTATREHA